MGLQLDSGADRGEPADTEAAGARHMSLSLVAALHPATLRRTPCQLQPPNAFRTVPPGPGNRRGHADMVSVPPSALEALLRASGYGALDVVSMHRPPGPGSWPRRKRVSPALPGPSSTWWEQQAWVGVGQGLCWVVPGCAS